MSEEYTEQESGEELIGDDSSDELLEEYEDSWDQIIEDAIDDGVDIEDEEDFGDWLAENYEELDEEDEDDEEDDEDDEEGDPEGDPEDEDELGEKMSGAQRRKEAKKRYAKDKKDPAKMKRRAKLAKISAKKRKGKKVKKRGALKAEFDHNIDEDQDIDEKMSGAQRRKKAKKDYAKRMKTMSASDKAKLAKAAKKARKKRKGKPVKKRGALKAGLVPSTKNQMLKNIYDEVNGMLKSDLAAKYEQIMGATSLEEIEEETVEPVRTKVAVKAEDIQVDVKDDVEALVQGEEGLTEEFKSKASTIFEAAVQAKVVDEVNAQVEKLASEKTQDSKEFQQELTEKVDGYLSYVVEEWMKENELAIERGIRTELVEDFMSGLKTLFTEHYIDIPEEKVDMVDDLFTKVEDLESSLDEEINRGVELQKELSQFKKDEALREVTKDLADTETEKISKLAEGIEYENDEQYTEKLNVLKESYFPKSDAVTSEITETDEMIESEENTKVLSEDMSRYTQALTRYSS